MTATDLQGRTEWEADEYARDHGKTAAMALGYQLLARHVIAWAAEDMQILGMAALPGQRPWTWPVTKGGDEERKARVDAWAARHGVTAHADESTGHYQADLTFGPHLIRVYMVPDQVMADRVREADGRLAALRGAVAEAHAGMTGSVAA